MQLPSASASIEPKIESITVDNNNLTVGDVANYKVIIDNESAKQIKNITLYFYNMFGLDENILTLEKKRNNIFEASYTIGENTLSGDYLINQVKFNYLNGSESSIMMDMYNSWDDPNFIHYIVNSYTGNLQIKSLTRFPDIARPGENINYELNINESTSKNLAKVYLELINDSTKKIHKVNMLEQTNGKYIGRMGIIESTDSGNWKLRRIVGETIQGQNIYIDQNNMFAFSNNIYFDNLSVEVTNKRKDIYPPIVDSISLNKDKFNEGDIINLTVKAHDEDNNGVREDLYIGIIHEETGTYDYLYLYEKSPGVYIANKEVLPTDLKGNWKFFYISISDKLGNNNLISKNANFNGFEYTIEESTERPTTEQPTTEQPTTEQPTTEQPTTEQPTTEQPTTEQPTTERPTTERPTTERPTTEQPTTEQPTTERPTTEVPTTEVPTTEQPTTERPTTERPTTEQPTTERPTTERPTTERPVIKPPVKPVVVKSPTLNEKSVTDKSTSISGVSNSNGTVYVLSNNKVIGKANVVNGKFKVNFKPVKAGSTLTIYTELNKLKSKPITIKVKKAPIKKITVATPVINQKYISNKTTSISGSSKSNGTVYVLANNKVIGKANVSKGKFKVKFKAVAAGKNVSVYTVQNKVKSKYVNFKVVDKIAPKPPVVNKVTTKSIKVTGSGEKYAQVTVYKGKTLIAKSAVNNRGKFALKINKQKKNTVLNVYLTDKSKNKSKAKSIKVS
ncbi:hypothetical protein GTN30_03110 [Macrococcoides canis]|uniref:Bacterial Ig domain-containing protein n=1 Tax=Macrococcoides canis TaxID=1855823 RepID=A0AAE6WZE3_9STAP|nr:Ig-like domain-containing protein [Macrococcus canis]QIH77646.1 hypothetical protein GTN30_03110 [Macrococcus canis]